MNDISLTYSQIEQNILVWAQNRVDIHGIVIIGSRARVDHPADERSDLDLILFCEHPEVYAASRDWLDSFCAVWFAYLDRHPSGSTEWFVVYQGGLKVDLYMAGLPEQAGPNPTLKELLKGFPFPNVFQRGVRPLLGRDSSGVSDFHLVPAAGSPSLPTGDTFQHTISRTWFSALRAAKLIQRGELWQVNQEAFPELRTQLLTLLEWEALSRANTEADVWYGGRFIKDWVDSDTLNKLPAVFAGYDQAYLWKALYATMELFHETCGKVAERLGFIFPSDDAFRVIKWIKDMEK